jgi:hypothetical protein
MLSNYYQQQLEEQRRRERLASKEHDRAMLRHEAERADQELREQAERWALEKRERETRLANSSLRERIEMGMSLVCFLCAIVLLALGSHSGQALVLGGSGVSGLLSFACLLHISFNRRKESSPQANPPLSV